MVEHHFQLDSNEFSVKMRFELFFYLLRLLNVEHEYFHIKITY